jgi:hypothetical protein
MIKSFNVGDTLTAAQANALPVGSQVEDVGGGYFFERYPDGWGNRGYGHAWHDGKINSDGHTLIRVGPAAFAVGDVVTREQLDALPVGAEIRLAADVVYKDKDGLWRWKHDPVADALVNGNGQPRLANPTITFLPSTNPHAPGSLAWARWAAEKEGVCVRVKDFISSTWAHRDGCFKFWDVHNLEWTQCPIPGDIDHFDALPWSIVPDPSAAEMPVETTDDTIDSMVDEFNRQQSEEIGSASDERFAALTAQMVALKAERDALKSENIMLREARDEWKRLSAEEDLVHSKTRAECDRLRTENADLLATCEVLKRERNALHIERNKFEGLYLNTTAERDATRLRARRTLERSGVMEAKPFEGWALYDPKGIYMPTTLHQNECGVRAMFHDSGWAELLNDGFQCLPVTVAPREVKP